MHAGSGHSNMEDTVWEDMTLRFPHLARKIFEILDDCGFARCCEVCRPWKYFYDNEKLFQKRFKTFPRKFQVWTKTKDNNGRVPLHWAAEEGRFQACKRILEVSKGIMKNPQDKYGVTPLHLAAQNDNFFIYQLISKHLRDWHHSRNPTDLCGTTPLHLAAKNGHLFLCKTMIQSDWCRPIPPIVWCYDSKNKDGDTPLLMAADNGHLSVCKLFLDRLDKKKTKKVENEVLDDIVDDRKKTKLDRKVESTGTPSLMRFFGTLSKIHKSIECT